MKKLEKGWYQIFDTGYKINPRWLIESACELFTVDALAIYAFIKITEIIF